MGRGCEHLGLALSGVWVARGQRCSGATDIKFLTPFAPPPFPLDILSHPSNLTSCDGAGKFPSKDADNEGSLLVRCPVRGEVLGRGPTRPREAFPRSEIQSVRDFLSSADGAGNKMASGVFSS